MVHRDCQQKKEENNLPIVRSKGSNSYQYYYHYYYHCATRTLFLLLPVLEPAPTTIPTITSRKRLVDRDCQQTKGENNLPIERSNGPNYYHYY